MKSPTPSSIFHSIADLKPEAILSTTQKQKIGLPPLYLTFDIACGLGSWNRNSWSLHGRLETKWVAREVVFVLEVSKEGSCTWHCCLESLEVIWSLGETLIDSFLKSLNKCEFLFPLYLGKLGIFLCEWYFKWFWVISWWLLRWNVKFVKMLLKWLLSGTNCNICKSDVSIVGSHETMVICVCKLLEINVF